MKPTQLTLGASESFWWGQVIWGPLRSLALCQNPVGRFAINWFVSKPGRRAVRQSEGFGTKVRYA